MAQRPAEVTPRFRVRGAPDLRHQDDTDFAGEEARQPAWNAERGPRVNRLRERGEPLAHRRGVAVDDVVDARRFLLDGEHRCRGGVVEMHEGPDTTTVTDDR